ncbi:MAG: HEAT repeat domain-containing protein, partial [Treponema sp.]|nr:HEAT repeat domain-containing protein [Treponema sp.]
MKKIFILSAFFLTAALIFAQESVFINETENEDYHVIEETETVSAETREPDIQNVEVPLLQDEDISVFEAETDDKETGVKETASEKGSYKIQKKTVGKKKPQKKTEDYTAKDEKTAGNEYIKSCTDTFKYGLETEISSLIDELTKNEDTRFVEPIYELFYSTKTPAVRNKILTYFTKLKDPCLCDYAVDVINDPYDEKKETVDLCFKYAVEVECHEAVGGLVDLVEKEEEDYFNGALSALAELGSEREADFLADYLDRDDLTAAQRQSLMRALGKMKALSTWDKLAAIAQDEDENNFVRMYAAEAIGAMEKKESEDILYSLYESDDPNMRIYVLKGISHFKTERADELILQALRDPQYKVRLEAVNAVKERKMKSAVPYIVYRCKHKDEEKAVKEKCWAVLAMLDTKEGNEYLVSVIKDKKTA